jgi:uncharacterized protein with GYD domain
MNMAKRCNLYFTEVKVLIASFHILKCPEKGRGGCLMLFIALVKFKKSLSKEVIAENLKDIEADTKGQVRYLGIYWTLGRYDTVVLFEAPNEKVAMNMALKRADRMDIEILVAVPAEEESPAGPA